MGWCVLDGVRVNEWVRAVSEWVNTRPLFLASASVSGEIKPHGKEVEGGALEMIGPTSTLPSRTGDKSPERTCFITAWRLDKYRWITEGQAAFYICCVCQMRGNLHLCLVSKDCLGIVKSPSWCVVDRLTSSVFSGASSGKWLSGRKKKLQWLFVL